VATSRWTDRVEVGSKVEFDARPLGTRGIVSGDVEDGRVVLGSGFGLVDIGIRDVVVGRGERDGFEGWRRGAGAGRERGEDEEQPEGSQRDGRGIAQRITPDCRE
jgi:hypothetical protein